MLKDTTLIFLALAQTVIWASLFYLFPALLLHWEEAFGWTRTQLTAAITLAILVSAFASPVVGKLIDQGLGPVVMTASAATGGICLFALSWVSSLIGFYTLWLLIGATLAGCLYDPCFSLITRSRGAGAKKGITGITLIAGFASTISFPTAHMLAVEFGWAATVRFFALLVIFVGAPLMWIATRALEAGAPPSTRQKHLSNGNRPFLKEPDFWFLALGFGFLAIMHGMTLHHLLPLLKEYGIATSVAVSVASLIGPMQVAGRIIMMWLGDRATHHTLAIICFLTLAGSIAMLMFSVHFAWLVFVFVLLFGGAYGTVSILRPVIARDILGEAQFGSKSGVLALVYLAGAASAPLLGSLIWKLGSYQLVLSCSIALALSGLGLYFIAARSNFRFKPQV